MRKYKRILAALFTLAMLLTLAGCQCKHEWEAATCLAPKTCTRCGLTEGEKNDHVWQAATCEAPETCGQCGLTRGEALGHTWQEATYQTPETCTTCGATNGEPLQADFEKYGLEINLWENKHANDDGSYSFNDPQDGFPYVTSCYIDTNKKTTGALYLSNYRIFQSDEFCRAVDGYEWRAFDVEIDFSDDNALDYGVAVSYCEENYYAIEDWDNSDSDFTGTPWEYLLDQETVVNGDCSFISFHGETMPVALLASGDGFGGWHTRTNDEDGTSIRVNTWSTSYYVCVPVGYDGVVIGFRDRGIEWEDGMYIYDVADENTLFFRLDDQGLDLE